MPARGKELAKELFAKAKDLILPDYPMLAPAFAAIGTIPVRSILEDRKKDTVMRFDTGDAPPKGSASRKLMDWSEGIDVLMPGEARDPKKPQMDYTAAQKEVTTLCKDPRAVHQYIAYEASRLCGNDPLVQKHTLQIIAGAGAEDFFFSSGESMKDICLGDPSKVPGVVGKLAESYGAPRKQGIFSRIFMFISNTWKRFTGNVESDPLNRPYFSHFFDRNRAPEDTGLNMLNGELRFTSARSRIAKYWDIACEYYNKGDKPRAFVALGHIVHLVSDLHVPAHVHNDPHGPNLLLGKPDSFEEWTARADYPSITRKAGDSNTSIWCARTLSPPAADRTWNKDTIAQKLSSFATVVTYHTQKFRSVDVKGQGLIPYQDKTGALNDAECFYQGETLIPAAITDSARMITNFSDYVKRGGQTVT